MGFSSAQADSAASGAVSAEPAAILPSARRNLRRDRPRVSHSTSRKSEQARSTSPAARSLIAALSALAQNSIYSRALVGPRLRTRTHRLRLERSVPQFQIRLETLRALRFAQPFAVLIVRRMNER